jgi:hypothetical protein
VPSSSALGDLLRAWHTLQVSPDESKLRNQIATLLQLERRPAVSAGEPGPIPPSVPTTMPPPIQVPPPVPSNRIDFYVITLPTQGTSPPPELNRATPLPRIAELEPPPVKPPLLNPRWERSLLTNLIAQPDLTAEPDLAKLIADLCELRPVADIPRQKTRSVRLGVEIWLDRSITMHPFLEDQTQLVRALSGVAGEARLSVTQFTALPTLSASPAPVVVVSDFGLLPVDGRGYTATLDEWTSYAVEARELGAARVIGVTPVPRRLWPASLVRAMDLLFWDVTSNERSIHRIW